MVKKSRKSKIKSISLFIIFLLIIIFVIINIPKKKNNDVEIKNDETLNIKEYKISLIMAGDALIHDRLYNDAYRDGIYDFKPYLKFTTKRQF